MTDILWTRSKRCDTDTCVEVAQSTDFVLVRESTQGRYGPQLRFTREEWRTFVAGVKDGEFDLDD